MHTVTLKGTEMTGKKGRSPRLRKDGTWVDRATPGDRELITRGKLLELAAQQAEIEAKRAARRHYLRMQALVLIGVGGLIVLTILALVLGLWLNAISKDFATELARTMLPILLGALATIVGAFFGVGANLNPNSEQGGKAFQIGRRRRRK